MVPAARAPEPWLPLKMCGNAAAVSQRVNAGLDGLGFKSLKNHFPLCFASEHEALLCRGRWRRGEDAVPPSPWAHHPSSPGRCSSLGLPPDATRRWLWALGLGPWALGRLGAKCPPLKAATKVHCEIQGLAGLRETIVCLVTFTLCPAIVYSQNL